MEIYTLVAAGSHWHHAGPWFLIPLLFWLVIGGLFWLWLGGVAAAIGLARRLFGGRSGMDRAVSILTDRYARGEISSEDYEERLSHLQ